MIHQWETVSLGTILTEVSRPESVVPSKEYKLLGIRQNCKGFFIKAPREGKSIKAKSLYRVEAGDILYNRLFAWRASFAFANNEHAGCYVSNEFPCFQHDSNKVVPSFLRYVFTHPFFIGTVKGLSQGASRQSRFRLKEERFLQITIPLPPLSDQIAISEKIGKVETLVEEANRLLELIADRKEEILFSNVSKFSKNAPRCPLREVAPIIRRKVEIETNMKYPELGIRSFGKGTFHKPAIKGAELGSKRIYRIEPGDLLFSNVFAWEGAIAVVRPEDKNRFGSHRFITCLPDTSTALAEYLRTWFLSSEGMAEIRAASPGAAGRNKTLNLKKLEAIKVPIPDLTKQRRFAEVYARIQAARKLNSQSALELETLMPAVLDKAFRGKL